MAEGKEIGMELEKGCPALAARLSIIIIVTIRTLLRRRYFIIISILKTSMDPK